MRIQLPGLLLLALLMLPTQGRAGESRLRLAVLDFESPQVPWLGVAVAEATRVALAGAESVTVLERKQTFVEMAGGVPEPSLLGVEVLLTGSVTVDDAWPAPESRLRIAVRLVSSATGQIRGDGVLSADGVRREFLSLQTALARSVVQALALQVPLASLEHRLVESLAAAEPFGRGLLLLRRASHEAEPATSLEAAILAFRRAQKLNDGTFFAQAHHYELLARERLARAQKSDTRAGTIRQATVRQFRADAAEASAAFYNLARALHAEGNLVAADEAISQYLRWLAETNRLRTWAFRYPAGDVCEQVDVVGEVAYVRKPYRTITCLNLKDGTVRWSRENVVDTWAIDWRNGTPYHLNNTIEKMDPATGKTVWTGRGPKASFSRVNFDAIRLPDGTLIPTSEDPQRFFWSDRGFLVYAGMHRTSGRVWDLTAQKVTRVGESETMPCLRSGNGERVLEGWGYGTGMSTSPVVCRNVKSKEELWRIPHPGSMWFPPLWRKDDILLGWGDEDCKGGLQRLDGKTGKPRWTATLHDGLYRPGHQLSSGSYPSNNWTPFGFLGSYVMAIDATRNVRLYDWTDGTLIAIIPVAEDYLALPALIKKQVCFFGTERAWAIPLDLVLHPRRTYEKHARQLRARILQQQTNPEQALVVIRSLLADAPLFTEGWKLRAELARTAGLRREYLQSRCQWLRLAGLNQDESLRNAVGLLRRFQLQSDACEPLCVGGTVYTGTRGGRLLGLDLKTLELKQIGPETATIHGLHQTEPGVIEAVTEVNHGYPKQNVLTVPVSAKERAAFRDPREREDPDWALTNGYSGYALKIGKAWVRPEMEGQVQYIADGKSELLKPHIKGLRGWQICVDGPKPVGYGTGGVYALDEKMRPHHYLLKLPERKDTNSLQSALNLAFCNGLYAMVTTTGDDDAFRLELWKSDFSERLRSVPIQSTWDIAQEPDYFFTHEGGFFLCCRELLWLEARIDGALWRFDPATSWTSDDRDTHRKYFDRPVIAEGRIVTPCRDGALYVFDSAAVTRKR